MHKRKVCNVSATVWMMKFLIKGESSHTDLCSTMVQNAKCPTLVAELRQTFFMVYI